MPTTMFAGRTSARPSSTRTPMVSVFDGRTLVGWIYRRGVTGFEVFDASEHSLGIFETEREALAALPAVDDGAP
jgi:hypothetical protein